jgi:exodeoxyribonuclease V alpha subunit
MVIFLKIAKKRFYMASEAFNQSNDNEQNEVLDGTIKRIIFESDSFLIAVLNDNNIICGNYNLDKKNLLDESVSLSGKWVRHQKYGKQFEFYELNISENEMVFFLNKIVKGISIQNAKILLKTYSENELSDILDKDNPTELLELKGIKEKKLLSIKKSWDEYKHLKEIGSFLAKFGVSKFLISKIYEFINSTNLGIDDIKKNPYVLMNIRGVAFKKADEIALSIGIEKFSNFRIKACMSFVLKYISENEGSSSVSKKLLYSKLDEELICKNKDDIYEKSLLDSLAKKEVYTTTKERYALAIYYNCENKILDFFKTRSNKNLNKKIVNDIDKYITTKEKHLGFKLDKDQKKAVKLINDGINTLLLIGYAGTGKSTSSKALLDLLNEKFDYDDICVIALSGIASQRINETTGYRAFTIQSLLITNEKNDTFNYKAILLDEASMVNSVMFYQVIQKLSDDCVFIIVGDDGQLPAIGAGDILRDAIKHNLAPLCKLETLHRQNEKQAIALIANDIRKGSVPNFLDDYEDFKFVDVSINNYYQTKNSLEKQDFSKLTYQNNLDILSNILKIASTHKEVVTKYLKDKQIDKALRCFQVITPIKNGVLGSENLNKQLQHIFNPRDNFKQSRMYKYGVGDKVIHIKNENMQSQVVDEYKNNSSNFAKTRIFNGQLGLIVKIKAQEEQCIVLYPNDGLVVYYHFDDLDTLLSLAYGLTIHKTQGMEYDSALLPMSFSHFIMHNTKLLYTAITRAKKMCYVVGESEAFKSGCKKLNTTIRHTVIDDVLRAKNEDIK